MVRRYTEEWLMAACKSCGEEARKEPSMLIHDGNELFISYEYGLDPRIDPNITYFCESCLRTDKAMELDEAEWKHDS